MTTQSLNNIVDVTVTVTPTTTVLGRLFNLGLIVGQSTIIPDNTRVKIYNGTTDMLANGWSAANLEYMAAQIYFSQNPAPSSVAIGRWDPTNNSPVQNPTAAPTLTTSTTGGSLTANTYYVKYTWVNAAGETQASAEASIITTGSASTITVTIPALPTGVTSANIYLSTTSGSETKQGNTTSTTFNQTSALTAGTALPSANTATVPETAAAAVAACRQANNDWYAVYVCDTVAADIEAVAAYIENATPSSAYFYRTADSAVLNGTTGNIMATLQTNNYGCSFGQYSTSAHATVAAMGYAMGANTQLPNSAFTLAYKTEVGVTPEALTSTQAATILGYNGNIYTNYGGTYNLLVQGTMADGTYFDDKLNLDVLSNNIQTATVNLLTSNRKITQTDDGLNLLINAITTPLSNAKSAGVIAPGVWNGEPILSLNTGDTLSNGYLILADTFENQSQADRIARKSPPIYVVVKLAGSIEHAVIGVIVNQ